MQVGSDSFKHISKTNTHNEEIKREKEDTFKFTDSIWQMLSTYFDITHMNDYE